MFSGTGIWCSPMIPDAQSEMNRIAIRFYPLSCGSMKESPSTDQSFHSGHFIGYPALFCRLHTSLVNPISRLPSNHIYTMPWYEHGSYQSRWSVECSWMRKIHLPGPKNFNSMCCQAASAFSYRPSWLTRNSRWCSCTQSQLVQYRTPFFPHIRLTIQYCCCFIHDYFHTYKYYSLQSASSRNLKSDKPCIFIVLHLYLMDASSKRIICPKSQSYDILWRNHQPNKTMAFQSFPSMWSVMKFKVLIKHLVFETLVNLNCPLEAPHEDVLPRFRWEEENRLHQQPPQVQPPKKKNKREEISDYPDPWSFLMENHILQAEPSRLKRNTHRE